MTLRSCCCGLLLLLVAAISPPETRCQESGSFRLDPKTGKVADAKRDYAHPDAAEVLKLVITDWMTNPKVKDRPYLYLIDPEDSAWHNPKLKLNRLLIDERYAPKGFDLKIPNVKVELFDRSKRDLKKGEMCIRIDRFEPMKDGSIEVEFVHSGYFIIGGACTTYRAQKDKGKWAAEFAGSFDP